LEVRDRHLERILTVGAKRAAALGLAPHSGWAVVVAMGLERPQGPSTRPVILLRRRIEMADSIEPGSKQPYHAVEKMPIEKAARRIASYEAAAARLAQQGLASAVDELDRMDRSVSHAGILESAGRRVGSLAATLTSHALIHTADGDHFRNALAAAAENSGLRVTRVRARDLEARAADALGQPAAALREILRGIGREAGPPWDADHRAAGLLAWVLLAEAAPGR
jgi:hypothetical protein